MSVVGKLVCAAIVVALCTVHETSGHTQSAAQSAAVGVTAPLQKPTSLAFIQAPEIRAGNPAQRFPRGSRLVRMPLNAAGAAQGEPLLLTPGMFAAANPQVSFDGRKLIFAAQTTSSATWQVFEIPSEGGTPQQITHCASDCVQPAYLPENQIVYTELQGVGVNRTSQVQVSQGDGTYAHPITFGPGRFEVETVLRSGRLLLSANAPLVPANGSSQPRALYVIDPDGSGLSLFRQDNAKRATRSNAQESADGTILFVQQDMAQATSGQLAWIHPGALRAALIAVTLSGYASITELADGTFVASRRGTSQQFDLYRLPANGFGHGQLLYCGARSSSLQAVPIAPHLPALAYRSILHPERTSGRIVCLDAYASKDIASGHLSGHVTRVRVLTKAQNGEKILGEAPVELDGSFYATVPADLPIRLILIGSKGQILKQQRSWMWVRKGEDRGCFGCHESQTQAPQNRSPMTLLRMDTPTPLLGDATTTTAPHKAARP